MGKSSMATIRAAGTVVIRKEGKAEPRVLLVHRHRHRDWSLPKGKLERDEHPVVAARRETVEETGTDVVLGAPLTEQHYQVDGRPKSVRYWAASVRKGGPGFSPNREVDKIVWQTPTDARKLLTYEHDFPLITEATGLPPTVPLIIVRHTQARRRSSWSGKTDSLRPLAAAGKRHAIELAELLDAYGIEALYSSDSKRCVDTLRPYANSQRLTIDLERRLSEEGFAAGKARPFRLLRHIATSDVPTAICGHRPVLPDMLAVIGESLDIPKKRLNPALEPGGMIVIHRHIRPRRSPVVVAIERHDGEPFAA